MITTPAHPSGVDQIPHFAYGVWREIHVKFDRTTPHDKVTWRGSSLTWLAYPNLDMPMTPEIRRNDFDYQIKQITEHGSNPNEMLMVMLAVQAAELGEEKIAGEWIQANLQGYLKAPFNVRSETATNNVGYILATSAGFIQSLVYGFTGMRIDEHGLSEIYPPALAPGWESLTLKNVGFLGKKFDIQIQRDDSGKAKLIRIERPDPIID